MPSLVRIMIADAYQAIVLTGSGKCNKRNFLHYPVPAVDIVITSPGISGADNKRLETAGIKELMV
jgi:DeoR/GlpR family transcriptional regulator of sugar metabolism